MQILSIVALFATATLALASPAVKRGGDGGGDGSGSGDSTYSCSSELYTPQCCAVDVLGLADLDCATPSSTPTDLDDFNTICEATGLTAECCILPVLDQGIICVTPV